MTIARIVLLAVAAAALTWLAGWWSLPVLGMAAGVAWRRDGGRAGTVSLAFALTWGALLVAAALYPRCGALSTLLGGIFRVPGALLLVLTIAFAALLGWSAAALGGELGRRTTR